MRVSSEWLSIRRKLPLLISALLGVVVAVISWASYRRLEGALVIAAGDRVLSVAQRLAGMLDESGRRLRRELRDVAADSTVVRFVDRPDDERRIAVERIFNARRAATPQIAWLEIQRRDGTRLLTVADAHAFMPPFRPDQLAADTSARGSWVGPLVTVHDSIFFSLVSTVVRAQRDTIGYVIEYRRISSAQGADALRGLIGTDAQILIGNRIGDVWTDWVKPVAGPPLPLSYGRPRNFVIRAGSPHLGAAAAVGRMPWVVWIELPRGLILAPARQYLVEIGAIASLLILIGALGAWLLSRHITTPLLEVMHASQDISKGDYSRRALVARRDEVGLLAESFNRMADQIEESTQELETRVASRTTELKTALDGLQRAQEELVRRERLAILGQLAGGVGHELRNPLGVMTNALYYLGMVLRDAPADVKEYLDILRTQVGLSEKIVGDLLDFARVKTPNREPVSLEQLVTEQLQRVPDASRVRVETHFPPTLPRALADRVQLGQAVLNLITNAVQAMTATDAEGKVRGTLTLRGRTLENGHVQLEVADTGGGIKPEHLDKVFEPLFTTKARGIGLGLAVSRALMRANAGDITVVSRAGEGATFFITLPTADDMERLAA
jgi:signal transduction histidine kinase